MKTSDITEELADLQCQHDVAVVEMIAMIDKVNELKVRLFKLKAMRDAPKGD